MYALTLTLEIRFWAKMKMTKEYIHMKGTTNFLKIPHLSKELCFCEKYEFYITFMREHVACSRQNNHSPLKKQRCPSQSLETGIMYAREN